MGSVCVVLWQLGAWVVYIQEANVDTRVVLMGKGLFSGSMLHFCHQQVSSAWKQAHKLPTVMSGICVVSWDNW